MSVTAAPLNSSSSSPIRLKPSANVSGPSSSGGENGSRPLTGGSDLIPQDSFKPLEGQQANRVDSELVSEQGSERSSDGDQVEISAQGRKKAAETVEEKQRTEKPKKEEGEEPGELTESEQDLVDRLKARDLEVRRHEQAHLTAAGDLANGPPKYDFQTGPDGKRYAIGGSVSIDVSPESEPEETIQKADRIKRAALAPAEPSGKDRQVASKADAMKVQAQQELSQEKLEEAQAAAEDSQSPGLNQQSDDQNTPEIGLQNNNERPGIGQQGRNNSTPQFTPFAPPGLTNANSDNNSNSFNLNQRQDKNFGPAAQSGLYNFNGIRTQQNQSSGISLIA